MATLSWLKGAAPIPTDGLALQVEYRSGNQQSHVHLRILNPILAGVLGCPEAGLFEGSMNLWAGAGVALPEPWKVSSDSHEWLLVPVVLGKDTIGVVARRADSGDIPFLEVFACEKLASRLKIKPGDHIQVRLLSGAHLRLAASSL